MYVRIFVTFAVAFAIFIPSVVRAQFMNSIPLKNNTITSPMVVTASSLFALNNGKVRVCISFRNVSNKPASEVDFTFRFDDPLGSPMREQTLPRTGSFGPGVLIEGLMSAFNSSSDSLNNCVFVQGAQIQPRLETIDETSVVFADGTSWKKGQSFVAAYTSAGTKLANVRTIDGTGTPSATSVTVTDRTATGHGGIIAGAGGGYGTIAWFPGSRTAVGTAVDATSQDVADYDAMSKCNALAPNKSGCLVEVRMSGVDKKCGAVATDDSRYGTAYGSNPNDTIKAALDSLQQQGGTLGTNNIVASACNTR